jgi:uncharacterized protein with ParB-like and HNH nuclease domain
MVELPTLTRWPLAVPLNQRRYAWEEEYVEQLLHDLTKAFDADKPIYFLGTIVLTEGVKAGREVADGQQQLATVHSVVCDKRLSFRIGRYSRCQPIPV